MDISNNVLVLKNVVVKVLFLICLYFSIFGLSIIIVKVIIITVNYTKVTLGF